MLGYYEANHVERDFNEATGYMRNAEKKAVKDAANLASQLIDDLGLDREEATLGAPGRNGRRKKKPLAVANIAPAGGEIYIELPLEEGRELHVNIFLEPVARRGVRGFEGDNLEVNGMYYRVENPTGRDRYGNTNHVSANVKYKDLLAGIQREVYRYLPKRKDIAEGEYKISDKVEYTHDGGRTWTDGVVVQPNDMGGIRIDTGQAPVLWVNAHPDQLRHKEAPKADVDAAVKQAKDAMAAKLEQVKKHLDKKMLTEQIAQRDKYIDELGERVRNGERTGTFSGIKNVDLQSTLLKCIGERDALKEALDHLPSKPSTEDIADNPQSWVGKTFTHNDTKLVCTGVDGNYAVFDNKSTFMSMGFEVPTVQGYLKSGKMQVAETPKGAKPTEAKEAEPQSKSIGGVAIINRITEHPLFKELVNDNPDSDGARAVLDGEILNDVRLALRKEGYIDAYKRLLTDKSWTGKILDAAFGRRFVPNEDYVDMAARIAKETSAENLDKGFGKYQKAYDDFVYGIEHEGMLPNVQALRNRIAEAKRRLTTLEKGAAISIKSDEDLKRHEDAVSNFTHMRDAFQAMLDYVNGRMKATEAEAPKANANLMATNQPTLAKKETKKVSKKKVKPEQKLGDLFAGSLFDKEEDNGLERNHEAVRTEGLQADGSGQQQGLRSSERRTGEETPQEGGRPDTGRGRQGDGHDRPLPTGLHGLGEGKNARNNHSERGEDHAPTSVNARIEANIEAIELARKLLESGETATPEQMRVLRQFSGWGGLGAAFNHNASDWKIRQRNQRIHDLLGQEAYEEAVMSANSAYYTPAYVVDTLWDVARQLGFKGGNILEGSAGIGNILGQMPLDMSGRSNIHAIEIDGTSGGILSLLYPDAKVDIKGFEQTKIPNGSVDLAITNVPFVTGLRVNDTTGDRDLSKKFHNIHDFCIAKNVRKLREGGLGIFISSNGTLDNSQTLRDWVVSEGDSDFIGAFRMNNKTFGGTTVTSDIIVIRKRVNGKPSVNAINVSDISGERSAEYQVPGEKYKRQLFMDYNKYFIDHPDHMAGEMRFAFEEGDTFRPMSKGLYPVEGKDQGKMLQAFVETLSAEEPGTSDAPVDMAQKVYEDLGKDVKEGSMMIDGEGNICIAQYDQAVPIRSKLSTTDKKKGGVTEEDLRKRFQGKKIKGHTKAECFKDYTAIKEALSEVMKYQTENEGNAGLQPLIDKLNRAYDSFVTKYGYLHKNNQLAWLRKDVDYPNVLSLENYQELGDGKGGVTKTYGKADVMKHRVVEKENEPHPENVKDGVVVSMFKNGRIDIPYIAEQTGKSEAEVKREIIESKLGYEDPVTRQMEVSYSIFYFDDFVRNFGNIQQMMEHTTSGKYQEVNRFAGYVNLPELVRIWSGVADTVLTKDQKELVDKIPAMEGGKAQDIYLPQTRALRSVMKYVREQLKEFEHMSGKEKKENSHIPVTMYGVAQRAAVDARLVMGDAEDDPNSKTNEVVRQTLRSLKDTDDYKGTVAIFADHYQNKLSGFNLYEDIKKKLVAAGVPEKEIVVMKSGMTINKKLDIFDKVNHGEVRVIMGSTATLGTGVNIQERLHTLIHVDAPNRPMDYTQRNGRILRQGNLHKEWGKPVRVLRFGVEDSLDVTAYQRLKTKGAIADSIMEGDKLMNDSMNNRVLEEEEDVFGDTVAQLSGSEYALLKNNAEKKVRKYESRKKQWEADQTYIHNAKPKMEGQIKSAEQRAEAAKTYLQAVQKAFPNGKFDEITVGKQKFSSVESMGEFIKDYNKKIIDDTKAMKENPVDDKHKHRLTLSMGGYDFVVNTELYRDVVNGNNGLFTEVHRKMTYSCPELGLKDVPVKQSLLRNAIEDITENVITGKDFAEQEEYALRSAEHDRSELAQLKQREGKPFEFGKELEEAKRQLEEYSEAMKKELEEKEKKYAEMDKSVEAASDVYIDDDEEEEDGDGDSASYRIVDDPMLLNELEDGEWEEAYRVMQVIDGELYPPMAAVREGDLVEPIRLGLVEQAEEHPELITFDENGKPQFLLNKGQGKGSLKAAYNPYWHTSRTALNDQFSSAYIRPNLVVVRTLVPKSELTSGYKAQYAKDAVGEMSWHSGTVSGRLAELGKPRRVILSRYDKPMEIIPHAEVARMIAEQLEDTDIAIPYNVVWPQLRDELEELGVEISDETSGTISEDASYGKAEYVTDRMIAEMNEKAKRGMANSPEAKRTEAGRLSSALHTPMTIIEDTNAITHDNPTIQARRRKSKGWYDTKTGEVVIVLPNNRNVEDVAATVLHETVGHKGLREIIGEKGYSEFLREVYDHVKADVRRRIAKLAANHNWDFEKATDEYLSRLTEKGFEDFDRTERTVWQWLKEKVTKAIDKFLKSLKLPKWVKLGDNELRYMLWRSKEHLERGKEHPIDMARDIVKREELGLTDEARYNMGDAPETFKARQKRAEEMHGVVMPGLNDAKVTVVKDIPRHPYTGSIAEATQQAIDASKKKYAPNGEPKTLHYDNHGAAFDYSISGNAIEVLLSPTHQGKSVNKGVHLALAEHLDEVINNSIEVEEHPDRLKTSGARDNGNINPNALMHRFYGVARVDGTDYRIMTLMREENRTDRLNGIHSYEVQKIEVLDAETPNTSNGAGTLNSELEGYPLAKVIQDVGKTMEKDKKLLAESKKPMRTPRCTAKETKRRTFGRIIAWTFRSVSPLRQPDWLITTRITRPCATTLCVPLVETLPTYVRR